MQMATTTSHDCTILLVACPCCAALLQPVPDGTDYRYARCLTCARVYYVATDLQPLTPVLGCS